MIRLSFLFIFTIIVANCGAVPVTTNRAIDFFPGIAAQRYVPGTEDMPLYDGFKPTGKENVAYDSIDGRIVNAKFYHKTALPKDVRKFYDITLPELGWEKLQYQIYQRDGEKLRLSIIQKSNTTILHFIIRPSS